MKKIVNITAIFLAIITLFLTTNVYAASLQNINITTDKQTVNPGENVTVNIEFGESLGSYTFDIAYDNNLLEYVSAEGGTADDNGTRIRVYFYDTTGGQNPRNNMSVTFKGKTGITTSNPTDLSITAEGLANADATVVYDDITTPIIKNLVVEPAYEDYRFTFEYTGDVIVNEEKNLKITLFSDMGKTYEHTRILAEARTPNEGTVKLFATDSASLEHDIIQSGWGSAEGDPIGGKDVLKELNITGLFDTVGEYAITLKLIDRDNSDAVIATQTFYVIAKDLSVEAPSENETTPDNNTITNNTTTNNTSTNNSTNAITNTAKPESLPQTGNTIYLVMIPVILILIMAYTRLKTKE